jgi:hypothetical protein
MNISFVKSAHMTNSIVRPAEPLFTFSRQGVYASRQGLVIGRYVMHVPLDVIESIVMSPEEARALVDSMSPGTLHLLQQGGGSPRFLRALQLTGVITLD